MFGQAQIDWDQNPEADLAGYKIFYNTDNSTNLIFLLDVGLTATPTAPEVILTSFPTYGLLYFFVKAYDTSGNLSEASASVSKAIAPVLNPMVWH